MRELHQVVEYNISIEISCFCVTATKLENVILKDVFTIAIKIQ